MRATSEGNRDEGCGWQYARCGTWVISVFVLSLLGCQAWLTIGGGTVAAGYPGFLGHRD